MPWSVHARYVRCGKYGCACSEGGAARHGPYWYGFERGPDGKTHSKYFGKRYPPEAQINQGYVIRKAQEAQPEPSKLDPRWIRPKRMDWNAAMRIMGFISPPSKLALALRYRELMREHHPDHNGEHSIAVAINLAYEYLSL